MKKWIPIIAILLFFGSLAGHAQSNSTFLIYGLQIDAQYYTRVVSDTGNINTYPTLSGMCGSTTPNGLLDAESHHENPTEIRLSYIPTNEIFATIPWRDYWDACTPQWLSNSQLIVYHLQQTSPTDATMFEIVDHVLREVPVSLSPVQTLPDFPYAYDTISQIILPSHQYTKFLYYSCPDEPTIPPVEYCTGSNQGYTLYDVTQQQEIAMLTDAADIYLTGEAPNIYSYHAWSSDDRYFLYPKSNFLGLASPAIYDTVAQITLDTGNGGWDIDTFRLPIWSPDSRYVAFWGMGLPDIEENTDEQIRLTYRTIYVYDTQQQRFIFPNLGLEIGQILNALVWSPNTPEFVVWDVEGNLYQVNVETVTYELIDTKVTGVIGWTHVDAYDYADFDG